MYNCLLKMSFRQQKKYEKEVERIDAIQEDVTIVKEVLQEHSEKLLKMA